VMKRMDCASPGEIIEAVYVKKMTVAEMAALSSVVTEAADAGDIVAAGILEEAGEELARMAATVAKRLRLDKRRHEVATVGSVFTSDQLLDSFTRNLRTLSPRAVPVSPEFPQVFGSVMLAMRREGIELSSKVLSVLASSMKRLPKSVVANPRAYRAST
jgi:N-acetylglucosamine kinase-like BadF-type ATPase